jgi:hypothetical protein
MEEVTDRSVEEIARLPFEVVLTRRVEYNVRPLAEILDLIDADLN